MADDVVVRVEHVHKKFCRYLKRSLWYGLKDIGSELIGRPQAGLLRPDEFWAVDDVSFELRRGECLGLIGRNGAGKTTLLKMLNGLIKPDKGRIELHGRVGALIALGAGFNPILTGKENIYVNGSVLGLTTSEIDDKLDEIVDFAEIGDFLDTPVRSYSSGMHVRLGFAVATALKPDVLLIDEVLAVGDARFRWKCAQRIKSLRESGVPIILVSHNQADQMRNCTTGLVLENGCKIYEGGTAEALLQYNENVPRQAAGDRHHDVTSGDTNKVAIVRVSFRVNGSLANVMKAGDDLEIEIVLHAQNSISPIRVVVGFSHSGLGHLFSLSSYRDKQWWSLEKGRTTIRLALKDFPIQFGSYHAAASIRGSAVDDIYCEAQTDNVLAVTEPLPNYEGYGFNGVILPATAWTVLKGEETCQQQ